MRAMSVSLCFPHGPPEFSVPCTLSGESHKCYNCTILTAKLFPDIFYRT